MPQKGFEVVSFWNIVGSIRQIARFLQGDHSNMHHKEWTIMIYMSGDNNLAIDMAQNLEQIKAVAQQGAGRLNLMVYYDGNSPDIPTLYCDFSEPDDPKYVRSYKLANKLYDVPRKPNENSADPKSLKNFVDWCVNTEGRRAKRYALIFSGHSAGFEDKGLFKDETAGKTMSFNNLFFAIQRMILPVDTLVEIAGDLAADEKERETTELIGQHLDILGFDSCMMGMLEVGYQFSNLTNYMIVSEGAVPSAGWTYAKILGRLAGERANVSSKKLAAQFVRDFVDTHDKYTVGGVSVDMAAWNFDQYEIGPDDPRLMRKSGKDWKTPFDDLADAFDMLGQALLDCFVDRESIIYKQMERIILKVHWQCQSYMLDQNVDLGDLCELLIKECESVERSELAGGSAIEVLQYVQDACKTVLEELDRAVILSGFSGGEYQYSNGVSVFFPWSWEGYSASTKSYESTWFVKDSRGNYPDKWHGWSDFLEKYLSEVALRRSASPMPVDTPFGSKYWYESGIVFSDQPDSSPHSASGTTVGKFAGQPDSKFAGQPDSKFAGQPDSKFAGQPDSKFAGQPDSKFAGAPDSKFAGQPDSKFAGQPDSKFAGQPDSKFAGQPDSKFAGQPDSKFAGQPDSKSAGQPDSKFAGQPDSKFAGQPDSKFAGQPDSKFAGQPDSKFAGQPDSKFAGQPDSKFMGGGAANTFFTKLGLFKNIEKRYRVSGYSKRPKDPPPES